MRTCKVLLEPNEVFLDDESSWRKPRLRHLAKAAARSNASTLKLDEVKKKTDEPLSVYVIKNQNTNKSLLQSRFTASPHYCAFLLLSPLSARCRLTGSLVFNLASTIRSLALTVCLLDFDIHLPFHDCVHVSTSHYHRFQSLPRCATSRHSRYRRFLQQ